MRSGFSGAEGGSLWLLWSAQTSSLYYRNAYETKVHPPTSKSMRRAFGFIDQHHGIYQISGSFDEESLQCGLGCHQRQRLPTEIPSDLSGPSEHRRRRNTYIVVKLRIRLNTATAFNTPDGSPSAPFWSVYKEQPT